jgi:hypothetical protein
MTKEDIIRMAREASAGNEHRNVYFELEVEELEAFAALVAAAEREACAKVAGVALLGAERVLTNRVLKAILARGQA